MAYDPDAPMSINSSINDGDSKPVLPEGEYLFRFVEIVEKGRTKDGKYDLYKVKLKIYAAGESIFIEDYFTFVAKMKFRFAAFFRSIGDKQHGEDFVMNWSEDFLRGKWGRLKLKVEEFTTKKGTTAESNKVDIYLDRRDGDQEPVDEEDQASVDSEEDGDAPF